MKGVGPRLGFVFGQRGIEQVRDLLYFFPRAYEDRSKILTVGQLKEGEKSTLTVTVLRQKFIPIRKTGGSILEVHCQDDSGPIALKWFHAPRGLDKRLVPGTRLTVTGKIKKFNHTLEMIHPEITWDVKPSLSAPTSGEMDSAHVGRTVPIYVELDGISTKTLRNVLWEASQKYCDGLEDDLPDDLLKKYGFPKISQAIRSLHFPPEAREYGLELLQEFRTPAHQRLIYEEFLKFEYLMLRRRIDAERNPGVPLRSKKALDQLAILREGLSFELTQDQNRVLQDIMEDFMQGCPMNRLVQGDVGSGKTVVCLLSAAYVLEHGYQATLMAPTEILAEQHFKNAVKLFSGKLNVALLTGRTPQAERVALQHRLDQKEPIVVIGTHALLEDPVVFSNLALVMIDEQHRFGVEQRSVLRKKGEKWDPKTQKSILPHLLLLSATPIPRTLALTAFGDLAVSSIQQLPPGRSPVKTHVIRERAEKLQAYEWIRSELKKGRQAFFIYPLVNESEAEGFTQLKSAVQEAQILAQEVFPEFRIGLLHGQLSSEQKEEVMSRFKDAETQILVSTTVVEVGVDVPNATVMFIEHSERFGLSQLHQLRGRVGRGSHASVCFLSASKSREGTSFERLQVLEQSQDGFFIAEADLKIRGPGEFLGTRQSGSLPFKIADLVRDREILLQARDDAMTLLNEDLHLTLPQHASFRNYLIRDGKKQFHRLMTS